MASILQKAVAEVTFASGRAVLADVPLRLKRSHHPLRTATSLAMGVPKITARAPTRYGGVFTVTLVPGDGVGKEITDSVKEVFESCNVPVEWDEFSVSGQNLGDEAEFLKAVSSLRRNKVGLKGILYTPTEKSEHTSWNVMLRKTLDVFASVSLCKSVPGAPTRHTDVDFVVVRENTEGEYSGMEHSAVPGKVVESLKIMTQAKTERIARFAFDFAKKNNRKKVTCVHKANIMKLGDGLFLNTCKNIAAEYENEGISFDSMIVDNTSMQLVARPQQFDVMVMPNLYGSIISNIGAALVGGPGIVPGANIGREFALFEPGCRHVAMDIKGKDAANPTAMLLSATMMLRHLGLDHHANLIANAVYKVIAEGNTRTPDLGGKAKTTDFTHAVLKGL